MRSDCTGCHFPRIPEGWARTALLAQISGALKARDCFLHSLGSSGSTSLDTAMVLLHHIFLPGLVHENKVKILNSSYTGDKFKITVSQNQGRRE